MGMRGDLGWKMTQNLNKSAQNADYYLQQAEKPYFIPMSKIIFSSWESP
jgi:hypothetical protein